MNTKEDIPEFGIQRENEERRDGGLGIIFDPETQKYAVGKDPDGFLRFFGGGVGNEEDITEGILREVLEESGLSDYLYVEKIAEAFAHYHNNSRNVNRITKSTCLLIILKSKKLDDVQLEEHEKFTLAWATPDEIIAGFKNRNQEKDYDHWMYFLYKSVKRAIELDYDTTSVLENIK